MKKDSLFLGILSLFVISCFIVIFVINNNVVFELNGEDNVTIEVNSNYEDEGCTARVFKKDISENVQVKDKVDYSKVGSYDINYYLTYIGKIYMLTRKVNIVDSIKPDIKLNGKDKVTIYVGDVFDDEGAIAIDNYDGDITENITVDSNLDINKEGNYTITYSVKDSSGNENSVVRYIKVIK